MICSATVATGLSASSALCMTTETSRKRKARRSSGDSARTSRSAKRISPEALAHDGRRRSTASPKVDFPLPDSPASPKISPG